MLRQGITRLISRTRWTIPNTVLASHTSSCPAGSSKKGPAQVAQGVAPRALKSPKCRFGFVPDTWFTFFHVKTGVSGLYVLGIVLGNYIFSKEILVMEHEYYGGLSVATMLYLVSTKLGPQIGAALDKEVDAVVEQWESGRKMETSMYEEIIKSSQEAIVMAEGQKGLMDAKKENVAMQLEAAYRERCMMVYRMVRGRLDYHVKRYYADARIQQKWMIDWILKQVMQSITADFERQALDTAISDLSAAAGRA